MVATVVISFSCDRLGLFVLQNAISRSALLMRRCLCANAKAASIANSSSVGSENTPRLVSAGAPSFAASRVLFNHSKINPPPNTTLLVTF